MKYISNLVTAKDLKECNHENHHVTLNSFICEQCGLEITLTE